MPDRFRSRDVVAFTGVKARQLEWRDERGVVIPARNRRLNTTRHLGEVAVLCHCQRKGFLLQGVKKGMRFLLGNLGKRAAEIVDRGSEYYLLTQGTHLYLGVLGEEDRGHPEKFEPVDSGFCLSGVVAAGSTGIPSGKANTSVTSPDHRKRARKAS